MVDQTSFVGSNKCAYDGCDNDKNSGDNCEFNRSDEFPDFVFFHFDFKKE